MYFNIELKNQLDLVRNTFIVATPYASTIPQCSTPWVEVERSDRLCNIDFCEQFLQSFITFSLTVQVGFME